MKMLQTYMTSASGGFYPSKYIGFLASRLGSFCKSTQKLFIIIFKL